MTKRTQKSKQKKATTTFLWAHICRIFYRLHNIWYDIGVYDILFTPYAFDKKTQNVAQCLDFSRFLARFWAKILTRFWARCLGSENTVYSFTRIENTVYSSTRMENTVYSPARAEKGYTLTTLLFLRPIRKTGYPLTTNAYTLCIW